MVSVPTPTQLPGSFSPLIVDGLPDAAMPLARVIYECGLSAQWVAQVPDAAEAFTNEGIRARRNLRETLRQAASAAFRESATRVVHADDDFHPSLSDASARYFEQLCLDLEPAGYEAYAVYRAMSALSHAGAETADAYVRLTEEGHLTFAQRPRATDNEAFLSLVCAGLIWSARALDFFEKGRPRRNELRARARELGVADVLEPSQGYYKRRATRTKRGASPRSATDQ